MVTVRRILERRYAVPCALTDTTRRVRRERSQQLAHLDRLLRLWHLTPVEDTNESRTQR